MGMPQIVTKSLIAANAANIVASATPVSGTAMTLVTPTAVVTTAPSALGDSQVSYGGTPGTVGALFSTTTNTVTLDTARRVLLTYGNEAAARTMVITGTNHFNNPITETLNIPAGGAGTIATLQDFLTVTQVLPGGGGWTAAVTVGTNSFGSSPWLAVSTMVTPVILGVTCVVTGAVNYSIEYTNDNPNGIGLIAAVIPNPFSPVSLFQQSTSIASSIDQPFQFWRLTINSGTGSVTATGIAGGVYQ